VSVKDYDPSIPTVSERMFPGVDSGVGFGQDPRIVGPEDTPFEAGIKRITTGASTTPLGAALNVPVEGLGQLATYFSKGSRAFGRGTENVIDYITEPLDELGGISYEQLDAINDMQRSSNEDPEVIDMTARNIIQKARNENRDISRNELIDRTASEILLESGPTREESIQLTKEAEARGDFTEDGKPGSGIREMSLEEAAEIDAPDARDSLRLRQEQDKKDEEKGQPVVAGDDVPLTRETLKEALDKNRDEAIAAQKKLTDGEFTMSGLPSSGLDSEVGKKAVTTLNAALSQEGNEDVKAEIGQKYIDEFMARMPKYEGKTRFEKGMDLMKFGMAIAAGDSPNAVENISKGFLAMGDTFTQDAKEKRAYKRELGLAAAKYSLNRIEELRKQKRQDVRNIETYRSDKKVTLEDGTVIPANTPFNLNMDYIARYGLPSGARKEALYLEHEKILAAQQKNITDALNDAKKLRTFESKDIDRIRKGYVTAVKDVKETNRAIANIDEITKDIVDNEGNIFGATGAFTATKENVAALFGLSEKSTKEFSRKEWDGKLTKLLQQSIPIALRENQSANSISNFDVKEFVKGYFDGIGIEGEGTWGIDTLMKNPQVLFNKLLDLRELAATKRTNAFNTLDSYDTEVTGMFLPTGVEASTVLDPYAGDRRQARAIRQSLEYDDETDQYYNPAVRERLEKNIKQQAN